jgi:chromosome partitioning protein
LKTIVVSNRKGGSAKTTTAVNLATELSKTNSVLLIDFDTQGHASIGVGCSGADKIGAHSIFQGATLSETFLPTILPNLTLSPALEIFDIYEYADLRGILKNRFRREQIDKFFDYCIIDTAPTYDSLLKNALEVANAVVIPVVPHHLGVVGVGQMFRAIYRISMETNNRVDVIGALPVMYNQHINEHKEAILSIEKSFGKDKIFSPIRIDIELAKQFSSQNPLVLSEQRKRGAIDYKNFTKELIEKISN